MTYDQLKQSLSERGFTRVERDDRLLDILPTHIREKGIELWEKWSSDTVKLVRLRLPYNDKKIERFSLSRKKIKRALLNNQGVQL